MTILSDTQWKLVKPLLDLPKNTRGGRPRTADRKVLEGILWMLRTGAVWRNLPKEYGIPSTCWRRYRLWQKNDTWSKIWKTYSSTLSIDQKKLWSHALYSGFFYPCLASTSNS